MLCCLVSDHCNLIIKPCLWGAHSFAGHNIWRVYCDEETYLLEGIANKCLQLLTDTETTISTGNVDQFGPTATLVLGFMQDARRRYA